MRVSDGSGGRQYSFDTDFHLDHCFVSKEVSKAEEALTKSFEEEMGFPMPITKVLFFTSEVYNREAKVHNRKVLA